MPVESEKSTYFGFRRKKYSVKIENISMKSFYSAILTYKSTKLCALFHLFQRGLCFSIFFRFFAPIFSGQKHEADSELRHFQDQKKENRICNASVSDADRST
jgi:hypothetical protein